MLAHKYMLRYQAFWKLGDSRRTDQGIAQAFPLFELNTNRAAYAPRAPTCT